jgi:hypothetical protein
MALCKYCSKLNFSGYRNPGRPDPNILGLHQSAVERGIHGNGDGGDDKPLAKDVSLSDKKSDESNHDSMYADAVLLLGSQAHYTGSKAGDLSNYKRTARDIIQSRAGCQFCSLVARHLEKQHTDLDEGVEFSMTRFCATIDSNDEFQHVHTTNRMAVRVIPDSLDTWNGPLEAHELAPASKKQPRNVLELQGCCLPVPTTGDQYTKAGETQDEKTDSRFSGRLINPNADLGLFAHWITLCRTLHGKKCEQSVWPSTISQALESLLVIDVERMCIVDAPDSCQYVALSYCWGTAPMLKHLLANSTAMRTDGVLADSTAPATIRDAITLVNAVGERYLWVDALCIVQDDPAIQQKQLAQMGLIYSLAAFTIVAAAGTDANAGLPGVRPGTRDIDQSLIFVGQHSLITVVDGDDYYGGVKESNWVTRGWTMQEKILSKKTLIFTDQQVYWNCSAATWLEEVVLENVSDKISFQYTPSQGGSRYRAPIELRSDTDAPLKDYTTLVNSYMERQLSYQSDILNAFSGICQVLSAIGNESFHWGLPVSRFDKALFWRLRGGGTRNRAVSDVRTYGSESLSVPFPSWSWTAWHGSSGESWISWTAMEPELHTKSEPAEIIFYYQDSTGEFKTINQISHSLIESQVKVGEYEVTDFDASRWWKESTQHISNIKSDRINPGLLFFWTSTAKLYVSRKGLEWMAPNASRAARYLLPEIESRSTVFLETTEHLPFRDPKTMAALPESLFKQIEGDESRDIIFVDFVVIGSQKYEDEKELLTLAVEWENGVAYRIGIAYIKERAWNNFEDKTWKQITLG